MRVIAINSTPSSLGQIDAPSCPGSISVSGASERFDPCIEDPNAYYRCNFVSPIDYVARAAACIRDNLIRGYESRLQELNNFLWRNRQVSDDVAWNLFRLMREYVYGWLGHYSATLTSGGQYQFAVNALNEYKNNWEIVIAQTLQDRAGDGRYHGPTYDVTDFPAQPPSHWNPPSVWDSITDPDAPGWLDYVASKLQGSFPSQSIEDLKTYILIGGGVIVLAIVVALLPSGRR